MKRFLALFSAHFDAVLTENRVLGEEKGDRIKESVAADARARDAVCAVLEESISRNVGKAYFVHKRIMG